MLFRSNSLAGSQTSSSSSCQICSAAERGSLQGICVPLTHGRRDLRNQCPAHAGAARVAESLMPFESSEMSARRFGSIARQIMISLLAMLLLAATPSAPARQSPPVDTARQLLQLAVHLEEAIGDPDAARSEERRVGKECRSWWSPDH